MPDANDTTLPPAAETAVIWNEKPSRVHEFWCRAGEVKDLRREIARLKQAAAQAQAEA
jgi:hypothetical protein